MDRRDSIGPIVTSGWLLEHLDSVVVCEVTTGAAGGDADEGRATHIAGSRPVVLDDALAAPPGGVQGRHPLPTPASFVTALGQLGIGVGDTVIAYDGRGGAYAARLVWMLRILNQRAALLDGGRPGWEGPVTAQTAERPWEIVDRAPVPWPRSSIADADEVAAHIASGGIVIDSRDRQRFVGEVEPIDPVAGHIPGAINLPFAENTDEAGLMHPRDVLAARFGPASLDPDAIVYCGSGVTACHNALAMEAAGLPMPRVYVGSWSGWCADPTRVIATGP